ncbi:GNAT family N-acetyltransferase [Anaerophaga thermohalophila]|jgi:ribosomal protein S18 acetylase RimI-like enzyme|uniref:GNAT family N-acetyltransferase n=1 Tax=Anaerophaga thermohalophila TaxID=177400 RepID=UPI0002D961AB|nr:GNAT family N-acetyltransferase [Anaerophaga thermohalophila]
MYQTNIYSSDNLPSEPQKQEIVDFLFTHLDRFGDPKEDITKAIDYSLKISESFGGFVLQMKDADRTIGAVVINKTGMDGYIPGNILVYIAIHRDYRGKGLGKELMKKALSEASGDVALHVEPDNPAKKLYEKFGFTNKYLEMRYKQQ